MRTALIIVSSVLFGVFFLSFLIKSMSRYASRKTLQRFRADFPNSNIIRMDEFVNFRGVYSRGYVQLRGNGTLALTEKELVFVMFSPKNTYRIKLEDIERVEIENSFFGYVGRKVLIVFFSGEGGSEAYGFVLKNENEWKIMIEAAAGIRYYE